MYGTHGFGGGGGFIEVDGFGEEGAGGGEDVGGGEGREAGCVGAGAVELGVEVVLEGRLCARGQEAVVLWRDVNKCDIEQCGTG